MSKIRPVVQPVLDDARLDAPIWAINLLDRRRPWAYELYGRLAAPLLLRAGGRLLAKGVDGELLVDDSSREDDGVETVLVVSYPSADAFLRLAGNPLFGLISLLRKIGLRGFRFGFAHRLDPGPKPAKRPKKAEGHLLTLLWDESAPRPEVQRLDREIRDAGAELLFAGRRQAILALDRGEGEPKPTRLAPPLPWSHVALVTGDESALRKIGEDLPERVTRAILHRRQY